MKLPEPRREQLHQLTSSLGNLFNHVQPFWGAVSGAVVVVVVLLIFVLFIYFFYNLPFSEQTHLASFPSPRGAVAARTWVRASSALSAPRRAGVSRGSWATRSARRWMVTWTEEWGVPESEWDGCDDGHPASFSGRWGMLGVYMKGSEGHRATVSYIELANQSFQPFAQRLSLVGRMS